LRILERQNPSQALPWLGALVESCDGAYDMLPVPCLCEFLMNDAAQGYGGGDQGPNKAVQAALAAASSRKQQLINHLRGLIRASSSAKGGGGEEEVEMIDVEADDALKRNRARVLEYFFQVCT
jgi:hypothetical protein